MEVEADLAKCPNARVAKASDKFFFDCIGIELGIVGMHADGNAHVGRLRVQPSSSRLQRSTIAPSRQLVEWKRPIFGRVDDLAHEIDPACRTTHELPCGIGQHVDMGMRIGHRPFERRRRSRHLEPFVVFTPLVELEIVLQRHVQSV